MHVHGQLFLHLRRLLYIFGHSPHVDAVVIEDIAVIVLALAPLLLVQMGIYQFSFIFDVAVLASIVASSCLSLLYHLQIYGLKGVSLV